MAQAQRSRPRPSAKQPRRRQPVTVTAPSALPSVASWVVASTVVLSAVGFWLTPEDPVSVVKLTVICVGAIAAAVVGALLLGRTGRAALPRGAVPLAVAATTVALTVSAVVAESTWIATVGQYRRNTGLVLYAACIVLAAATALLPEGPARRRPLYAVVVGATLNALYALLQRAGLDPVDWAGDPSAVIATLGNPNFVAAYVGIAVPLALWVAVDARQARQARIAAAVAAVALLAAAVASRSVQGPITAVAGAVVFAGCAFGGDLVRRGRSWLLPGGGVALLAAGVAGLGVLGIGPLSALHSSTVTTRGWYWTAALQMWRDHPVLGVGLDSFGEHYRAYRPVEAIRAFGTNALTDEPHSVPLAMAANGGALLAAAYLALVVTTAVLIVRGLRRLTGPARMQLAAVAGAWAAYQLQSLISIEQPPLALVHWVLVGSVLAVAGPPPRVVEVFRPRMSRPTAQGQRYVWTTPGLSIAALAGVLAVPLLWMALTPLRADVHYGRALAASDRGDTAAALTDFDDAVGAADGAARYWHERGALLVALNQSTAATGSFERALEGQPRFYSATVTLARRAAAAGDLATAQRYFDRARELDPVSPDLLTMIGTFEASRGDTAAARAAFERALEVLPGHQPALTALEELEQQREQ